MNKRHKRFFSLVEIIVVTIIFAVVSAIVVKKLVSKGPGEYRREMQEQLNKAFTNAAVRSRGFNQKVDLIIQCDTKPLSLSLKASQAKSTFDAFIDEHQTEEQIEEAAALTRSQSTWGGDELYTLPEQVEFFEANQDLNEEAQLIYSFYPDGEASGPNTTLIIGDDEYEIVVDRLTAKLNIRDPQP